MRGIAWLVLAGCAAHDGTIAQPVTSGSADPGDPAVIALVDDAGHVDCTAAVIEAHTAVTAAHCVVGLDPRTLRVWSGGDAYSQVTGARAHPMFDAPTFANDIALVSFRDPAQAAPLVLETTAPAVATTIRVVGWGRTSAAVDDSGELRAGSATISDVQSTDFTAMPAPSQPCRGDSGGPALMPAGTIGGVVSHGDTACSDHAVYTRVDVANDFVTTYLADTAPGTASTGDACLYDGQCTGGPCVLAEDDPRISYCSAACAHDGDCPAGMDCANGECRYPPPSPGALGAACVADAGCITGICRQGVCTQMCTGTCPSGFACTNNDCLSTSDPGCGGCNSGGGAGALIALLVLARARRTGRRA
jgi:hypothetical protein